MGLKWLMLLAELWQGGCNWLWDGCGKIDNAAVEGKKGPLVAGWQQ